MEKEIMILIGRRLRRQRERIGMTREEFAEKSGISPQFLAEIENGKKGMSTDTLYNICRSFNISADYLLFGSPMSPDTGNLKASAFNLLSEPYISYTEDIIEIVDKIINVAQKEK